jgi:ribosome recycling factor
MKDGEVTEDDNKKLHEEIQKLLKQYEDKVGEVQERKSTEILEV